MLLGGHAYGDNMVDVDRKYRNSLWETKYKIQNWSFFLLL